MSSWLVGAMGVVYSVIAIEQFIKGGYGQGIMFTGYAIGNLGILFVVK